MCNFNVVLPKYTVNDFTDALQQQLLDVLHESISGAGEKNKAFFSATQSS